MASSNDVGKYDNVLLGILQSEGQITPFLDAIFGFLYRRTDYYRILRDDHDTIGFREGVAEALAIKAFKKFQKYALEDEIKRLQSIDISNKVPSVVSNEEVVSSLQEIDSAACSRENTPKTLGEQYISYNGAVQDKYCWSQSLSDLDVHVKISEWITKANLVKVTLDQDRINIDVQTESGQFENLINGKFLWKINLEESMWTLVPGEHIHINLCKREERWWDALLEDESKIDLQKIDNVASLDELPEDEQAKLEELIYNERQKALNKPTTEQLKMENILKKAWDAEGSPFLGQPFDLSAVNLLDTSNISTLNLPPTS